MNKLMNSLLVVITMLAVTGIFAFASGQVRNTPLASNEETILDTGSQGKIALGNAIPADAEKPASAVPGAACPNPLPATGIFPYEAPGPFSSRDTITNRAVVKSAAGFYYEIWAGSPASDPDKGLIRILEDDPDPCQSVALGNPYARIKDYITAAGPVALTKIEGDEILFRSADGRTGRFNFVADHFLP